MADHLDWQFAHDWQIALRTTSNRAGHPFGIVTGSGPSPDEAIRDLAASAPSVATTAWRAGRSRPRRRKPGEVPQPTRFTIGAEGEAQREAEFAAARFEVVDVRLVAGHPDADSWAAIGTLCQVDDEPDM